MRKNQSGFSLVFIILGIVVLCVLYLIGYRVFHHKHPAMTASQGQAHWIISSEAIDELKSVNASDNLLNTAFNSASTYFTGKDSSALPNAIPTQTFTSFAAMQSAFNSHTVASTVGAILYDNEDWQFTPSNEQQDPVDYAKQAAQLAHDHGLKLIFTPATDLLSVLKPGVTSNKYNAFLSLNILGQAAKYVDAIDIQAQGSQGTSNYASFIQQAAEQIKAVNNSVEIFGGMSSEPSGKTVSAADLLADYNATKQYVEGYWMNIPVNSSYCPNCKSGNPAVALSFLESIYP